MPRNDQRPPLNLSDIFARQSEECIAARRRETLDEIARLRDEIRHRPGEPGPYLSIAGLYSQLADKEAEEMVLRDGLAACPSTGLYWRLFRCLRESGRTEEAIPLACRASETLPQGFQFRFADCLMLPSLYESEEQLVRWRSRFIEGIQALEEAWEKGLATPGAEMIPAFLEGLKRVTNFYLAYQGYDDLALQRRYGTLVHRVMQTRYPQWNVPLPMPALAPDEKIRVGIVSHHFYEHTVTRLFTGWLEYRDRGQFQFYSYYSGSREDSMTDRVRDAGDVFHHIPDNFEAMCRQLRSDQLHLLIFTDIGMTPETTMLAALRLAPVQCMTWGHPVTSGLPTMDYYLSSDLMEPPGAQQSYSERLVLLPGIGICVEKPWIPRALLTKPRSAWGIPADAVVYLCCQSLFKYLPRHDYIFPAIAHRVPGCRFVFFAPRETPSGQFQARLRRAFSAAGLNADEYCLLLPAQNLFEYWNVNLVCDVFLDSLGWSGGMTTLDAIACDLPVVTLPGEFMRGRHSWAILTQLGIGDTIASSEADYIDIAARLGVDPVWRKDLVRQIRDRSDNLYSDKRSAHALGDFIRQVVSAGLADRPATVL